MAIKRLNSAKYVLKKKTHTNMLRNIVSGYILNLCAQILQKIPFNTFFLNLYAKTNQCRHTLFLKAKC